MITSAQYNSSTRGGTMIDSLPISNKGKSNNGMKDQLETNQSSHNQNKSPTIRSYITQSHFPRKNQDKVIDLWKNKRK
jgi:hypothetical protein